MKTKIIFIVIISIIMNSCINKKDKDNIEKYKLEIIEVEREFAEMANSVGLKEAFVHFAADSAVLSRGNKLIKGRSNIANYFPNEDKTVARVKLEWAPDFVDVSESGDLAYTYGPYTYIQIKKDGEEIKSTGIFHTVWKRQEDGSWKYVWD